MSIINALQKELDGYTRRGLNDRAQQVAAQLAALGCEVLSTKTASFVPTGRGKTPTTPTKIVVEVAVEPEKVIKNVVSKVRKGAKK